ncbi:SDH family Clp fold serine proteinase [Allokutzneria oryzae]|uniref:Serine dehydrogenase proteinase n=1 Tax=Allokutzneria oryzae TaxID=1378989 RepID=A0ABV5ZS40_9PSEU
MNTEKTAVEGTIDRLERSRGRPLAVIAVQSLEPELVPILARCLRAQGRVPALDLLLNTFGGKVDVARRLALLVREYTDDLTVLVADHARSAGTLLCLAADRLELGPASSLGPLDPHLSQISATSTAGPHHISTAELRAFTTFAQEWCGLQEGAERAFATVSQRIFPSTVGALLRAERHMLAIIGELAARQVPDPDARERLAARLVTCYHSHDHDITRAEAGSLGLVLTDLPDAHDSWCWDVLAAASPSISGPPDHDPVTIGFLRAGGVTAWQRCLPARPDRPETSAWWDTTENG